MSSLRHVSLTIPEQLVLACTQHCKSSAATTDRNLAHPASNLNPALHDKLWLVQPVTNPCVALALIIDLAPYLSKYMCTPTICQFHKLQISRSMCACLPMV
jgi:hypothetical protein